MGVILWLILGLIWLYVVFRFVLRLRIARWARITLAIATLIAAEYQLVTSHFFGTLASPELPRALLIVLAWAFGTLLLLTMLLIVRDVFGIVLWLFSRRGGRAILGSGRIAAGLGILAAVLAVFGLWQAIKVPAVRTVHIEMAGLPAAFDGYRIVQLWDLHASRLLPASWMRAVVAKTNALKPDLIVITGDLEDGTPAARAADVAPLAQLRAPDGVLAVPGNHEYYADYAGWMAAFRKLGLHMLTNSHTLIHHHGHTLAVAGLTDRQAKSFGLPGPNLDAALEGIPAGVPVIVLSHRPDKARVIARAGVALELAGHTHGGQILGPDRLTKWVNNGFVSGLYHVNGMSLYVSNGTGLWNGLAIRIGRPSEITQIILAPKSR
jgi:predicted MPP superfamily phosphohydrolase